MSKGFATAVFLATICTAILVTCSSTDKDEGEVNMRELVPEEIHGWIMQDEVEIYDRETIFDYIDGAGEIYLMYAFRKVAVFRLVGAAEPDISVEVFDMGSSGDAFGIFSHAREGEELGIGQGSEYRGGVLCFWKAHFFVCIVPQNETAETKKAVGDLARKIAGNIPLIGAKPELLDCLPEDGLVGNTVRYFHRHTSLNYHYFVASENILQLGEHTQAVLAQYEPEQGSLLCIRYQNQQQAKDALDTFVTSYVPEARETGIVQIDDGKWVAAEQSGNFVLVVFDASTKTAGENLMTAVQGKLSKWASTERRSL